MIDSETEIISEGSNPRTFIVSLLVFFLLGACAIAAANILIDPFFRFDLVAIEGFNAQKPVFAPLSRVAKPGVVCRMQPRAVILGTSRVEVGMNPRYAAWKAEDEPVYNLALPGSGLKEIYLTLQHAVHASTRLRVVLVGLDFLMFNAHREAVVFGTEVVGFDAGRLMLTADASCWKSLSYDVQLFLGLEGLAYSYATIRQQMPESERIAKRQSWLSLYDRDGYRGNRFNSVAEDLFRSGAYYAFGAEFASQETYYVSRVWRPPPEERYCFERDGGDDTLALFRAIVDFARQSHLDVRFFVNPIHARMLLALHAAGLWPQYEEWKRRMVGALADEAAASGSAQFPLWDFSGFNTVTTESVAPKGVSSEMRWWWEPSHYRSSAGDLMLDRMLGHEGAAGRIPDDFGVALNPQVVESWTMKTREGLREFVRTAPGDAQLVRGRVEPIMKTSSGSNCGYDEKALVAASSALERADRDGAEAAFAKAIAIHDADRRRYQDIDAPYREVGFERNLALIRAGGKMEPKLESWQDYRSRGNARLQAGRTEDAIEDFSAAIRISQPSAALYLLRGTARLKLGQFAMAADDFVQGVAVDPQDSKLQTLLREAEKRSAMTNSLQ